ncbi:MAG: cupin domain-containing protein, partial [Candidatus Binatia bacterium]
RNGIVIGTVALAFSAACAAPAGNPRFALRYEKGWEKEDLRALVGRAGSGEVEVLKLGNTAWVSHHVAIVRTEERPHYHRFHDLTVSLLQGEGILNVDQRQIEMKEGDVAHINRGTPHFFRNSGKNPAVSFVIFSPPFDGRDTVSAKEEPKKAPEKEKKKSDWLPW